MFEGQMKNFAVDERPSFIGRHGAQSIKANIKGPCAFALGFLYWAQESGDD
jgi:hypothetical protein